MAICLVIPFHFVVSKYAYALYQQKKIKVKSKKGKSINSAGAFRVMKESFFVKIPIFLIIVTLACAVESFDVNPDENGGVYIGEWSCIVKKNNPATEHGCVPSKDRMHIKLRPDEKWSMYPYEIDPKGPSTEHCMIYYYYVFLFRRNMTVACGCYYNCHGDVTTTIKPRPTKVYEDPIVF